MNQLKRLFGPRNLAATFATGMLLHSALNALAGSCYEVSAALGAGPCPLGRTCRGSPCPSQGGMTHYWCCYTTDACGYCVTHNGTTWVAQCCP
jgi:hypothetical protein